MLRTLHCGWAFLLVLALVVPARPAFGQSPGSNPVEFSGEPATRVSTGPEGIQADAWSDSPALSANGQFVAFVSLAGNLVQGDTNRAADIFVRDQQAQQIQRVSISSTGIQAEGWSYQPAISGDGRYIAFASLAQNLVPGNPAEKWARVYLHDRVSGRTRLVSVAPGGKSANGWSGWPSISADGRFIAFASLADNLVDDPAGDSVDRNNACDVFVYDRLAGEIQRVSISSTGTEANGWSFYPAISADGRYVAFLSLATNLAGDQIPETDRSASPASLFVHDRLLGRTTRIPVPAGMAVSGEPAISADGGSIVFTVMTNMGPGNPTGSQAASLYLYNRTDEQLIPIPESRSEQANDLSYTISSSGRSVVFTIVQANAKREMLVYDQQTGRTSHLFEFPQIESRSPESIRPALALDGRFLAFTSSQDTDTTLPPGGNARESPTDIFVTQPATPGQPKTMIAGWVSDGLGHPLAGVSFSMSNAKTIFTGKSGNFRMDGLAKGSYLVTPAKKGYKFTPASRRIFISAGSLGGIGLAFVATPKEVIEEAQKDIGMPYALTRGCESPFKPCGGPFHGFFSGDCTDLVLDAYLEGAGFNIQLALESDFWAHPEHYYRWHDARSAQDMWRYFVYTQQMLGASDPYQVGDIVFFDWQDDGVADHVSIVSEVSSKGRPKKMIDATGVIDDNPDGRTAELIWKSYHSEHVQGHARWIGTARVSQPSPQKDQPYLLVALDARQVSLRVLDAEGHAISANSSQIDGGSYLATSSGAVISLRSPQVKSSWYAIELTSDASAPYQLGIQTIKSGMVTRNGSYQRTIEAGEVQLILVQLITDKGSLSFSAPALAGQEVEEPDSIGP